MTMLHVFDMDGILLRETTASLEIARHLGCLPDLIELEKAFAREALSTRAFAAAVCALWGKLQPEQVAEVFDAAAWIGGLAEVMADIRARGEHSLVVTLSPDFFARRLLRFGVDEVVASRFPALPFRHAPDPAGILTPADKISVVNRTLHRLKLPRTRCAAYGDSASDMPLFETLSCTVAVNAGPSVREVALLRYDGDDLREPYGLVRSHVTREGTVSLQSAGEPGFMQ